MKISRRRKLNGTYPSSWLEMELANHEAYSLVRGKEMINPDGNQTVTVIVDLGLIVNMIDLLS